MVLIAFEGPIAAGKTTLAQLFAARTGWPLVLEEFAGNEFLKDFYRHREPWSLPMQLWFLTARYAQLSSLPPVDSNRIADYAFAKDAIFATLLLRDRALRLYQRIKDALHVKLESPRVLVYLDATNPVLLRRIAGRGRTYEASIDERYLDALRGAYANNMHTMGAEITINIDTSELNLNSEDQLNSIFREIQDAISTLCD
jgi:deoxyguanosine kinase